MSTTIRRVRALVLASSLVLPFGVAVWATAVEAQTCANAFPATGQTTSYAPSTSTTTGAPVKDDGAVRAGGALRFQDNGDGTITDLNTQLMWEKKSSRDGSLHDAFLTFAWSSAVSCCKASPSATRTSRRSVRSLWASWAARLYWSRYQLGRLK